MKHRDSFPPIGWTLPTDTKNKETRLFLRPSIRPSLRWSLTLYCRLHADYTAHTYMHIRPQSALILTSYCATSVTYFIYWLYRLLTHLSPDS